MSHDLSKHIKVTLNLVVSRKVFKKIQIKIKINVVNQSKI